MDDIFNLNDGQLAPMRGSLLVAKPTVDGDDFFCRSVILLMGHDGEGSMGLVLNNDTTLTLDKVLQGELENVELVSDTPVYLGGPVQPDMLFFVHTLGCEVIPESEEVVSGLYFGGNFEALKRYVDNGGEIEGKIKFIMGYSGWSAGQLQDEIDHGTWAVLDNHDIDTLMTGSFMDTWRWAVKQFGSRYRLWLNCPIDLSDN